MSKVAKHSSLPWKAVQNSSFWEFGCDEAGQIGDTCASSASEPEYGKSMALGEANAKFICHAVNSHYQLTAERDALRAMLNRLEWCIDTPRYGPMCPVCKALRDDDDREGITLHEEDCELNALLAATPEAGEVWHG